MHMLVGKMNIDVRECIQMHEGKTHTHSGQNAHITRHASTTLIMSETIAMRADLSGLREHLVHPEVRRVLHATKY